MRSWIMATVWLVLGLVVGAVAGRAVTIRIIASSPLRISNAGATKVWVELPTGGVELEPGNNIEFPRDYPDLSVQLLAPGPTASPLQTPDQKLRRVAARELSNAKSLLPNWEQYAVAQRRPATGCIPTGYEFLLRIGGVPGIAFDRFQEEFDLGDAVNNFRSVADAVTRKYPQARFEVKVFDRGEDELRFIKESLDRGQPILVSLRTSPNGGWHIMPVLAYNNTELILLYMMNADGVKDVRAIKVWDFLRRTDDWGGREVAWLDKT